MRTLIFLLLFLPSIVLASDRLVIAVTPTVSTAPAYSANDAVGSKMTFSGVVTQVKTGVVTAVVIRDLASQAVGYELFLFNADPTATTVTDNAAIDIADADLAKLIAVVTFTSADNRYGFADNSVSVKHEIYKPFSLNQDNKLYGILRTSGTPTYASTSDIRVLLVVESD